VDKFIRRTVTSILLIAAVSVVIFLAPNWAFCLVVTLLVAMGQFEFFKMVENKKIFVYKYFGTIVGSLVPIVIFMGHSFQDLRNLEPLLIVVACLFTFTLQFIRRDNERDHLVSMAVTVFALFYIAWFFSFLVKLKFLENGAGLVAFLIFVTKGADIGAYIVGSRFGKTELLPRISPNKTKEGTLGGILISMVLAVILGSFFTGFSVLHNLMLGMALATIGQVGDLAESLIKRDCGIKDSALYISGIGGILDLIDSLLFTIPVFYFYIKAF